MDGRLVLIASTKTHLKAELESPETLGEQLGASIPNSWPCGEYDQDAMRYFLDCLERDGDAADGWYGWYALASGNDGPSLVGAGGYFGPPDEAGSVEIGYSIVPEQRGKGWATALADTLIRHAFGFERVRKITARTSPDNRASIRVLERCGFLPNGRDDEDGKLRFHRPKR